MNVEQQVITSETHRKGLIETINEVINDHNNSNPLLVFLEIADFLYNSM